MRILDRARLRGYIAARRHNLLFRAAAAAADKYLRAYNNEANWSFKYNGEENAVRGILGSHQGCVFDVGANIGQWTLMTKRVDASRFIHAFEISPQTFRTLTTNINGIPGCSLNNVGLSDHAGDLDLHYYPSSPDRSSLIDQPDGFFKEIQPVRVITGDSYIQEHGIDLIAFLKMDVEGHEMSVLSGLRTTLDSEKVVAIQFEHGPAHTLTKHSLGDFIAFFAERGYEIFRIFPNSIEPFHYDYCETYGPTNYLALRKGILS